MKNIFVLFGLSFAVLFGVSLNIVSAQNSSKTMSLEKSEFGKTAAGETVEMYTLKNANGLTVKVLNFGGVIWSFEVPDKDGKFVNVSANFETVKKYEESRPFFGSLVGRYGNRIAGGKFTLDGKEYTVPRNNGKNALHGGLKGFDQKIWKVNPFLADDSVVLVLSYTSVDGEEGYPGTLKTKVVYELTNNDDWIMNYSATTDKATVVNLTNHTFWNLAGAQSGTILEHELTMGADRVLPTDDGLIPTGEIRNVQGTAFDFQAMHTVGSRIAQITEPQFAGGYDHCFVLKEKLPGTLSFCAKLRDPKSGRTMTVRTTEPAVQLYTGNFFDGSTSVNGYKYEKHSALCLETQHYPDSPNQSKFPTTVLKPGETYRQTTIHHFSVE